MEQLDIFEVNDIEKKIAYYNQLIEKDNLPYDLVAVNKMYSDSAVIYDREDKQLFYVLSYRGGRLKKDYRAPYYSSGFGTNYHLVDKRFEKYESVSLTNKKRQYTSCAKPQLQDYMDKGWVPEG